jgi:alpha-tubulin suppressor-like RCC1 family protein
MEGKLLTFGSGIEGKLGYLFDDERLIGH